MNASSRRRVRPSSHSAQTDLFAAPTRAPEGLRYHPDVLSADEEEGLARELGALRSSRSTFISARDTSLVRDVFRSTHSGAPSTAVRAVSARQNIYVDLTLLLSRTKITHAS